MALDKTAPIFLSPPLATDVPSLTGLQLPRRNSGNTAWEAAKPAWLDVANNPFVGDLTLAKAKVICWSDSSDAVRVDDAPAWQAGNNIMTFALFGSTGTAGTWVWRNTSTGVNVATLDRFGNATFSGGSTVTTSSGSAAALTQSKDATGSVIASLVSYPATFSVPQLAGKGALATDATELVLFTDGALFSGGTHSIRLRPGGYGTTDALILDSSKNATFGGDVSVTRASGTGAAFMLAQSGVSTWTMQNVATSGNYALSHQGLGTVFSFASATGAATFNSGGVTINDNGQIGLRLVRTTATAHIWSIYGKSNGSLGIYDETVGADRVTIDTSGGTTIGAIFIDSSGNIQVPTGTPMITSTRNLVNLSGIVRAGTGSGLSFQTNAAGTTYLSVGVSGGVTVSTGDFAITSGNATIGGNVTLNSGAGTLDGRAKNYTVATLPTPSTSNKGRFAYATDGRAGAEGAGVGTGTLCIDNGTAWKRVEDWATVAA